MEAKITETLLNTIISIAPKIVNKVIENHKLTNELNNIINFMVGDQTNRDRFNETLLKAFDKENIKNFSKTLNPNNGFTIIQSIKTYLTEILSRIDCDEDYKESVISNFIFLLLEYLKNDNPDVYNEYITQEIYNQICLNNKNINSIIEILSNYIKEKDELNYVESLYVIESKLKKNTNPSIDLSFFEPENTKLEDIKLSDYIKNHIELKENMYIVCSTVEEAIYTLLFELSKFDIATFVVSSLDEWKILEKSGIQNSILIPTFKAQVIEPISNCINIFIYSDDSYFTNGDKFKIERRTKRTIIDRLNKFTNNIDKTNEIYNKTHGFLYPLMDNIFIGKWDSKYDIDSIDFDAVGIGILVQKWTNIKSDKSLIETLSNMSYDKYFDVIEKYMDNANPLFIKIKDWVDDKYVLTCPEKAFCEYYKRIPSSIKNKFFDLTLDVISSTNTYSNTLIEGIFETFAVVKYVIKDSDDTKKINRIIDSYLSQIDTIDKLEDLSKFIYMVTDINPDRVIDMFNDSINNNTFLANIFKSNDNKSFDGISSSYLFALEELLVQENYYIAAIDILFKLYSLNDKTDDSSFINQILKYVFCPWANISCLKPEDKASTLRTYCKKYPNAYLIAYECLPDKCGTITDICKPKYSDIADIDANVTIQDCINCYSEYFDICLEYANDIDNILSLMDECTDFDLNLIQRCLDKIYEYSIKQSDQIKEKIKYKTYQIINKHRYHCDTYWAMKEDKIDLFVKFASKIKFECEEYNYVYLFEKPKYDFLLLNPIPYKKEDEDNSKTNDKLAGKEIQDKIKEFNDKGLSLETLISISDSNQCSLGNYIHYFKNEYFSTYTMNMIINNQRNINIIKNYFYTLIDSDYPNIYDALRELVNSDLDDTNKALIISYNKLSKEMLEFLDTCSENILNIYWKFRALNYTNLNLDSIEKCYLNICKHGCFRSLIDFLNTIKDIVSLEFIYQKIINYQNINYNDFDVEDKYLTQEILKKIYSYVFLDANRIKKIAFLEFKLWKVLDWNDMICMRKIIKEKPQLYLYLVLLIFKKDKTEEEKIQTADLYTLYCKMIFCPGEKNGIIIKEVFNDWITTFIDEMNKNGLTNMTFKILGKLFAYSPICVDNYPIDYPVRDYIENNYNNNMASGYLTAIINQRGIYSNTQGEEENNISQRYKEYAFYYKKHNYPKCAKLYDILSDEYKSQSIIEREQSLYE